MSIYIRQWYCPVCHEVKAREHFPRHIDKRTPCLDCQRSIKKQQDAEGASPAQEQPAFVRRRVWKTPPGPNRTRDE